MSSSGPTKIIGEDSSSADRGRRQDSLSATGPDRLQQLAAAFAAEAPRSRPGDAAHLGRDGG